jgi:hypothetical protein
MKLGTVVPIGNLLAYVQTTGNGYQAGIGFANVGTGQLSFWQYNGTNGYLMRKVPTMLFRDPSSWYHVVCIYDTTNATAEDRAQIWVNGVRVTDWAFNTQPALNSVSYFAANSVSPFAPWLGAENRNNSSAANPFDGYLTEINFIDGQALTPSSFGSYNIGTGVWQPIKYSGTYGTNGFYLNFQDNSGQTTSSNVGIGKDSSGNSNYWVSNGITLTPTTSTSYDSMLDVPTNTSATNANFATLNPLIYDAITQSITNGNLQAFLGNSSNGRLNWLTIPMRTGKWYIEFTTPSYNTNAQCVGIISEANTFSDRNVGNTYIGTNAGEWSYGRTTTTFRYSNGVLLANTGTTIPTSNDIISLAFDVDAGTLEVRLNDVLQNITGFTGIPAGTYFFGCAAANASWIVNAGQRPFSYTPPAGYKRLCTYNLPTPTIPNGAAYMAATTYTGTGSALSIANTTNNPLVSPFSNNPNALPMQPDLVWIKGRLSTYNHAWFDSVRGARNVLISNLSNNEVVETAGTSMTSFDANGFSLGTNGAQASTNVSAQTFVAWQWKASGAAAVTNTNGTISSQVSANPTAGFSIVTYTGTTSNATVGHGLNGVPKFIMVKNRDSGAIGGAVYHASLGATKYLQLFQTTTGTAGETTDNTAWNGGSPTFNTSVFSVGALNRTNSAQQMVAYCWAEIPGFSKFGSYTGNGSANGMFVYLGFKPRWIMIKQSSAAGQSWVIVDTSRDTYNASGLDLYANLLNAEVNERPVLDILSNGFKLRNTYTNSNTGSATYIYACFAENPFNYSLAR